MTARPRWLKISAALALAVAGLVVAVLVEFERVEPIALARYRAIHAGMSRTEVRKLMLDAGIIMYTDVLAAEIMHIDGQFMIAVIYEPTPSLLARGVNPTAGPLGDNWLVKEKIIVELGRAGPWDDCLVRLGIRRQRLVDHSFFP